MKRLLIVALMAICVLPLSAQRWIGGSLWINNEKSDGIKSTDFSIYPEFGYQLNERWGVGVDLFWTKSFAENEGTMTKYRPYMVGLGPFVRYTLVETGKLKFFSDARLNYEYADGRETIARYTNAMGAGLRLGATYDLTERLSLYSTFGRAGYNYTWSGENHMGEFSFNLTSAVSIGLYVKF